MLPAKLDCFSSSKDQIIGWLTFVSKNAIFRYRYRLSKFIEGSRTFLFGKLSWVTLL